MLDDATIAGAAGEAAGARVVGVRQLGGGISNLTYAVRLAPPAGQVVVRVFAEPDRARSERAALGLLEGSHVPAPRLLGHGRLPGAGSYVVTTRVPGRPVARPDEAGWIGGLASALAAIHRVERRGRSLPDDPGAAREWIDEGPPPELGDLARTLWPSLERRREELGAGPVVLVHGDFHPGNVHWARGRVSGVIDWELARFGPAGADVAYCYMDLRLAAGKEWAERFRAAYAEAAGDPAGFEVWLLLAALRPLPDPARWLPSYAGAGYTGLTARVLRRRLTALVRSIR